MKKYFSLYKKDGKVENSCSKGVELLFNWALENDEPIRSVVQYMYRDINNPLVVLFILKNEVFLEIKGILLETDSIPLNSIR